MQLQQRLSNPAKGQSWNKIKAKKLKKNYTVSNTSWKLLFFFTETLGKNGGVSSDTSTVQLQEKI